MDPVKAKKRYIILTYLEKYNVNANEARDQLNESNGASMIKEEIEAENEKTHYPLPLSLIEMNKYTSIKE